MHVQSCPTLCNPTKLLCPWDFPGKNTGVGCHFLLQGTFLTQGSNLHLLCLLHCRQMLYLSLSLYIYIYIYIYLYLYLRCAFFHNIRVSGNNWSLLLSPAT